MKQRKIALGPGAASLILIIVVLSMCILCMLTYISARNDEELSRRSAESVSAVYALHSRSEGSLAALDDVLAGCAARADSHEDYLALVEQSLPEGMSMELDTVYWTEEAGGRVLNCAVQLSPLGDAPRAVWTQHALAVETEEEWN